MRIRDHLLEIEKRIQNYKFKEDEHMCGYCTPNKIEDEHHLFF